MQFVREAVGSEGRSTFVLIPVGKSFVSNRVGRATEVARC